MTDQPFQPFPFPTNGPVPAVADEGKAPPRRGRKSKKAKAVRAKKARRAKPAAPVANESVQVKTRRPRKARAVKIDLAIAASVFAGLKQPEADALNIIMTGMQPLNKKARAKIVGALGKVFA